MTSDKFVFSIMKTFWSKGRMMAAEERVLWDGMKFFNFVSLRHLSVGRLSGPEPNRWTGTVSWVMASLWTELASISFEKKNLRESPIVSLRKVENIFDNFISEMLNYFQLTSINFILYFFFSCTFALETLSFLLFFHMPFHLRIGQLDTRAYISRRLNQFFHVRKDWKLR